MTFDEVTEKMLLGLNPEVVARVRAGGANLASQGIWFRVYSGVRTSAQQTADYAKGRDSNGNIVNAAEVVTHAKAGQSSHNYGLAVDAVPFSHGESGQLDWSTTDPEYKTFVQGMLDAGLKWGGDWKTFKDMDHFYLGPDNPTQEMQEAYDAGTPLPTIWENLDVQNA